jgi:hypothetical protein
VTAIIAPDPAAYNPDRLHHSPYLAYPAMTLPVPVAPAAALVWLLRGGLNLVLLVQPQQRPVPSA